ncbi:thioredoxin domain-containing protein [Haematococcus lacustris]|uniref:Thioredoxin domain-containing protein n=1 Tax=Haematococcus lacustris TaxID=44745 RepID=A0A699ZNX3_HAELA|nr:thioredoxin domain-containing protein [Haematococcus lacustris]
MAYSRLLLVAVLSVVILSGHCAKTDAVSRETKVQILNDSNFDELTASGTWFVNLFAPWCGHCRQLAPTWDEFPRYLASFKQELPDAHVGKVDGTQSLVLVSRFRVEGYPSLYLLKGGRAWLYQGPRTLKALAVLHCGCSVPYKVLEAYKALKAQHGWSDMGILGAVLAVPVITGAATICLVDALFYRRARDGAEEDLVAAEAVPAAPLDANAQQEGEELRQGQ